MTRCVVEQVSLEWHAQSIQLSAYSTSPVASPKQLKHKFSLIAWKLAVGTAILRLFCTHFAAMWLRGLTEAQMLACLSNVPRVCS